MFISEDELAEINQELFERLSRVKKHPNIVMFSFPLSNSHWIAKLFLKENKVEDVQGDMDKVFAYHKPSALSLSKITNLRVAYSNLKAIIEAACPPSRERAVALTELETSAMWTIKSVVINDPKSEVGY